MLFHGDKSNFSSLEIGENFDDEDFNASKRLKLNKKGHRRNASDSIMSVGSKLSGKISGYNIENIQLPSVQISRNITEPLLGLHSPLDDGSFFWNPHQFASAINGSTSAPNLNTFHDDALAKADAAAIFGRENDMNFEIDGDLGPDYCLEDSRFGGSISIDEYDVKKQGVKLAQSKNLTNQNEHDMMEFFQPLHSFINSLDEDHQPMKTSISSNNLLSISRDNDMMFDFTRKNSLDVSMYLDKTLSSNDMIETKTRNASEVEHESPRFQSQSKRELFQRNVSFGDIGMMNEIKTNNKTDNSLHNQTVSESSDKRSRDQGAAMNDGYKSNSIYSSITNGQKPSNDEKLGVLDTKVTGTANEKPINLQSNLNELVQAQLLQLYRDIQLSSDPKNQLLQYQQLTLSLNQINLLQLQLQQQLALQYAIQQSPHSEQIKGEKSPLTLPSYAVGNIQETAHEKGRNEMKTNDANVGFKRGPPSNMNSLHNASPSLSTDINASGNKSQTVMIASKPKKNNGLKSSDNIINPYSAAIIPPQLIESLIPKTIINKDMNDEAMNRTSFTSDSEFHAIRKKRTSQEYQSQDMKFTGRGKYRCGRCGQPKVNHNCEYVEDVSLCSTGTQVVELIVSIPSLQPFDGEKYITVSGRKSIQVIEKAESEIDDHTPRNSTNQSYMDSYSSMFGNNLFCGLVNLDGLSNTSILPSFGFSPSFFGTNSTATSGSTNDETKSTTAEDFTAGATDAAVVSTAVVPEASSADVKDVPIETVAEASEGLNGHHELLKPQLKSQFDQKLTRSESESSLSLHIDSDNLDVIDILALSRSSDDSMMASEARTTSIASAQKLHLSVPKSDEPIKNNRSTNSKTSSEWKPNQLELYMHQYVMQQQLMKQLK